MANANTTAMSAEMTTSLNTYQNGGAELVNLIADLQRLVDKDYTIKVGVCSYGSGEVYLTLQPTVPESVVEMVLDHYTNRDDQGHREMVAKRSMLSVVSVANILETVQKMQK